MLRSSPGRCLVAASLFTLVAACGLVEDAGGGSSPTQSDASKSDASKDGKATSDVDCNAIVDSFSEAVASASNAGGGCTTNADCYLVTPVLSCAPERSKLDACPFARSSRLPSFDETLAPLRTGLCDAQCGVGVSPQCEPTTVRCVSGICSTVPAPSR